MNIIRIPTLGFIVTTIMATIGCSGEQKAETKTAEATPPVKENIQDPVQTNDPSLPTYTIGLDIDYPPYDYQDEFGVAQGFDVDIIKAIAKNKKFNINPIPLAWTSLLDGANEGKYDIVMGGFVARDDVTDEMRVHYNISNAYVLSQNAIATVEGKAKIDTFSGLKNYTVSTLVETVWVDDLIKLQGSSDNVLAHDTPFQGLEHIIRGQSDALLNDKGVLYHLASEYPEQKIVISGKGDYFKPYDLVYLANKNNPELTQKINKGISDIIKTGEYQEIYKKWFHTEPGVLLPSNSVSN